MAPALNEGSARRLLVPARLDKVPDDFGQPLYMGSWALSANEIYDEPESTEVLKSRWQDKTVFLDDYRTVSSAVAKLLPLIASKLNDLHGESFSLRAWDVMLGLWLQQFSTVVFDRLSQLSQAAHERALIYLEPFDYEVQSFAPPSSKHATHQFVQDEWNYNLVASLAGNFPNIEVRKGFVNPAWKSDDEVPQTSEVGERSSAKQFVFRLASSLSRLKSMFFWRQSRSYLMINTSLTAWERLKLTAMLGGPVVLDPPLSSPQEFGHDVSLRRELELESPELITAFERTLAELVPLFLPQTYVELFRSVTESGFSSLPAKVDTVFTSSSHLGSDVFRVWLAHQIDRGARFVAGQHGGGAPHPVLDFVSWERRIADARLVPGPGCILGPGDQVGGQYWSKIPKRKNPQVGSAVIVTGVLPRYVFEMRSMPQGPETAMQIQMDQEFYARLPDYIKSDFCVRLYPKGDYGWNVKERWSAIFPEAKLDPGFQPLGRAVSHARLVVVTYQASTYAEMLAANIPTILSWDSNLWQNTPEAAAHFDLLQDVGIFHPTSAGAASHVREIWTDIGNWWDSSAVQQARVEFCDEYAHRSRKKVSRIATVLKAVSCGQ